MTPRLRKLVLTTHIVSTVGWLGATAAFLALAIAAVTSRDDRLISSAYIAMNLVGWRIIIPLAIASLLTGLVQSLGSAWGLFRHYWVLLKFLLTVIGTALLLMHMSLASRLASIAGESGFALSHVHGQSFHIMGDAAAAILLLIVNTSLSVFKPRGLTPYGRRIRHQEEISAAKVVEARREEAIAPQWVKVFVAAGLATVLLFGLVFGHLSGGVGHHGH